MVDDKKSLNAPMAELVYALDLKSGALNEHVGSTPTRSTILKIIFRLGELKNGFLKIKPQAI